MNCNSPLLLFKPHFHVLQKIRTSFIRINFAGADNCAVVKMNPAAPKLSNLLKSSIERVIRVHWWPKQLKGGRNQPSHGNEYVQHSNYDSEKLSLPSVRSKDRVVASQELDETIGSENKLSPNHREDQETDQGAQVAERSVIFPGDKRAPRQLFLSKLFQELKVVTSIGVEWLNSDKYRKSAERRGRFMKRLLSIEKKTVDDRYETTLLRIYRSRSTIGWPK